MAAAHADLIAYGDTVHRDFPLILAIGREPNDSLPMVSEVGAYDFDEFPRCAFGNASYGLVAWANGLATRQLKQLCRDESASPLIYADAMACPSRTPSPTSWRSATSPLNLACPHR